MRCNAVKPSAPRRGARLSVWVCLPVALLLSGCFSNEPDANEIDQSIRASQTQRQDLMPNNVPSPRVEKLGCTNPPPGMAGLLCEFQVIDGNGRRYIKTTRRFLKVNGTWQLPD